MTSVPRLAETRRVVPVAPVGFRANVPEAEVDEADIAQLPEPDLGGIGGLGCIISYVDAKGAGSVRRITCHALRPQGTRIYLFARCHEKNAVKSFRLDGISEVICQMTGEVIAPPSTFFERYYAAEAATDGGFGLDSDSAADLRAALNVLAFLARADGRVVPAEQQVISEFCRSFGVRYGSDLYGHESACAHSRQLSPDADTFYASLAWLKRPAAPVGLSRLTCQFAERLIAADGVQHDEEFRFGSEVCTYLKS